MRWLLLILCAIHLVRYWLAPGWDSLWVDEGGTWWTIADGWRELWVRTGMHPNSRLYGALVLAWSQVAGQSEIMLRLPSLVAMLGAVVALAVWMERRFGEGMGWALVAMCLASPRLSFFALDARPYALAVLLLVVATLSWMSMCREWSWRAGVVWMVSAGLLVHAQPLLAAGLAAHGVWLLWVAPWREWDRRRWVVMGGLVGGAVLLAVPEIVRMGALDGGLQTATIPGRSLSWSDLRLLAPVAVAVPAAMAAGILFVARALRWNGWAAETARHVAMGAALGVVTMAVLAGYGWRAQANLLIDRYALPVAVGWMIALPALLAAATSVRGRLWFATLYSGVVLAASVAGQGWRVPHADAEWRGAFALVERWEGGRPAPLLVQSGLVEAAHARLLNDPRWQGFLQAPALYYRPAGPTVTLPLYLLAPQEPYFDAAVARVAGQRFAAVVYADPSGVSPYVARIAARCGEARLLGRFRRLEVYAFGPP